MSATFSGSSGSQHGQPRRRMPGACSRAVMALRAAAAPLLVVEVATTFVMAVILRAVKTVGAAGGEGERLFAVAVVAVAVAVAVVAVSLANGGGVGSGARLMTKFPASVPNLTMTACAGGVNEPSSGTVNWLALYSWSGRRGAVSECLI